MLQIDENNFQASFMLGSVFLVKEYYPAIANFLYTLRINPDFNNAKIALAESYYKIGRFKMAIKELSNLIQEFYASNSLCKISYYFHWNG